ncbi:MAG: hypothetical protein GY713_22465 [Actinomycetia bacterium]|nr:hypothetical protein [Actinomycetes bacterium]
MTLASRLRAHGVRMTSQRKVIVDALVQLEGFPTAADVFGVASSLQPSLSKATVYNALQAFSATGEIRQIGGKGETTRYAMSDHGAKVLVRSLDGVLLDQNEDTDLPIERVEITYIVSVIMRPPEPVIDLQDTPVLDSGRRSRPSDPVFARTGQVVSNTTEI